MPLWKPLAEFMPRGPRRLLWRNLGPFVNDYDAMSLLNKLIAINPEQRISCDKALDDTWFFKKPEAKDNVLDLMLTIPNSQFEFTAGQGAHASRGRHYQVQQQRTSTRPAKPARHARPVRPSHLPAGQLCDVIY